MKYDHVERRRTGTMADDGEANGFLTLLKIPHIGERIINELEYEDVFQMGKCDAIARIITGYNYHGCVYLSCRHCPYIDLPHIVTFSNISISCIHHRNLCEGLIKSKVMLRKVVDLNLCTGYYDPVGSRLMGEGKFEDQFDFEFCTKLKINGDYNLSKFPKLQVLDASRADVTTLPRPDLITELFWQYYTHRLDFKVENFLQNLINVKELTLIPIRDNSQFGPYTKLITIPPMKHLEILTINAPFQINKIGDLQRFPSLKELTIEDPNIGPNYCVIKVYFPEKRVRVNYNYIKGDECNNLAKNILSTELETIDLMGISTTYIAILDYLLDNWINMAKLIESRRIILRNSTITPEQIKQRIKPINKRYAHLNKRFEIYTNAPNQRVLYIIRLSSPL